MAAPRNRKHLLVPTPPRAEDYRPHPKKVDLPVYSGPIDRAAHAADLRGALADIRQEAEADRQTSGIAVAGAPSGITVEFESPPGFDLKLESLESKRQGIELLNVRSSPSGEDGARIQFAAIFIPDGALKHFFDRFEQYAEQTTRKGEPRHKDLVDRIAALRKATLRALWTDTEDAYPADGETIWWEVWLRRHDGAELARLLDFAQQTNLAVSERRLGFDDRIVILVRGSAVQLSASLNVLNEFAELRRAKESAAFCVDDLSPSEQADWVDDLKNRTVLPDENAPALCILDTGVTHGHPLLQDILAPEDATAVDPAWGAHDHDGHGTEMAGLAAYGDLAQALASGAPVHIRHRLESVKILPPRGANLPELYGAITAQAVARPEIQAPRRPRAFSMAVTATDERDRGQPTSWSAAIDALAAGRSFDPSNQGLVYLDDDAANAPRLFVLSAGNVDPAHLQQDHLGRSDIEAIHDPAHAWNALTVGAFTEKASITDASYAGWSPVAPPGDLSPWSTTSVTFQESWPLKPDVVCEGGNLAMNGTHIDFPIPDLSLLSTHHKPAEKSFTLSWATSAATAQVARMAATISAEYPHLWPESVRALLVQSARWTRAMRAHLDGAGGKKARARLVRRYGYGVPDLARALRSAGDALTLIAQASIRPFADGKMRELHLHELPWPKAALAEMGETPVRLRVTLSYFIEPNPGRRGWKKRHRYASHGLRFDMKLPTESTDEFHKRLNQKALEEDEGKPDTSGGLADWFIGEARNKGSLHSDIWVGTAADLAERGVIGVFPVSGWWKDQPKRDRSQFGARYSLIVTVETDAEGVDIWTPVAQEIGVPVEEAIIEIG
ncbi:MAG: S8 family peptidase [Alphaproteobacteria bacterium]|nr:S8 family peptidase [Alphaproteobacteria bacterium]